MSRRLPNWPQLAQVYAVIVMLIYGWTVLRFLWQVPSWLNFLNVVDLLTLLAYALAINLLESIVVLGGVVLASMVLPARWFTDVFVARGGALAACGLGLMMVLASQYASKADYPERALRATSLVAAMVVMAVVVVIAGRLRWLQRGIELLADHATVFLYASLPLSAISILLLAVGALR